MIGSRDARLAQNILNQSSQNAAVSSQVLQQSKLASSPRQSIGNPPLALERKSVVHLKSASRSSKDNSISYAGCSGTNKTALGSWLWSIWRAFLQTKQTFNVIPGSSSLRDDLKTFLRWLKLHGFTEESELRLSASPRSTRRK